MSKNKSYLFLGTLGDIVDLIKSLPPAPTQEFLQDWKEFIIEESIGYTLAREFYNILTKLRVRFVLILRKRGHQDLKEKIIGIFAILIPKASKIVIWTNMEIQRKKVQMNRT